MDNGSRTIRDPVHGDIVLGPIQAGIIDTPIFQKLRYIKQNSLLHFVFPGAVHTRFLHSIGAFHIAKTIFDCIFLNIRKKGDFNTEIEYLREVFLTAALLHDCGHTAFSHSIENIKYRGAGFMPSLKEIVDNWSTEKIDLHDQLDPLISDIGDPNQSASHEVIGLALIAYMGNYAAVSSCISDVLHVSPEVFISDVLSILSDRFPYSERFDSAARTSLSVLVTPNQREQCKLSDGCRRVFKSLIGGTLDIDRMDYLLRDSHFTGTTYGEYDLGVISNALTLEIWDPDDGKSAPLLVTAIAERACNAVDDFLWGRYQLFQQVLNHKANVMLNAVLGEVVCEMADDADVRLGRPLTYEQFIEFTDDFVMSHAVSQGIRSRKNRIATKVLFAREIPIYLGRHDITENDKAAEKAIKDKKARFASQLGKNISEDDIKVTCTKSHLIKGGDLPFVRKKFKIRNHDVILPPKLEGSYQILKWCEEGRLPSCVEYAHFFIMRDLQQRIEYDEY